MKNKNAKAEAQKRKVFGRKVKRLRKEGILPANVYGLKTKSQSIQMDTKEFETLYSEVGETGVVELSINGKDLPVLINNVQTDPATDALVHVDFLQVDMKAKITTNVPIELVGDAPAIKLGATIVKLVEEVEVEALPADLPEKIEVDVSVLVEFEDHISVSDIKGNVSYEVLTEDDVIVAKAEEPREEELEPEPEVEPEEGAEEGEEKTPDEATEASENTKEEETKK